jgi:AraC-like DNA-binding protein
LNVKIYIPHPALQEYVLNISTVNAILQDGIEEVVTPYPPSPFQSLMFYCNDPVSMSRLDKGIFEQQPLAVLVGPQWSRVNIKVHKLLKAIRVDFLPGGMYRMLGIPMHELFDGGFDATTVFGSEITNLVEELQNVPDLEEGKNVVEKFLLNQIKLCKAVLPFDSAMRVLLKNDGNMSIENAASLSCLSIKQFERKCKERVGMNPKMYARILKFSKAYRLHEAFPERSWIEIAHQAGYYDQMHMIRDFKAFAGVNPSIIQQQLLATPLRMQKDLHY